MVEPVRSILIPEFDTIKRESLEIGALGGRNFRIRAFCFHVNGKEKKRPGILP
ncbi:hypothetical protein [Chryseobacterium proteolyticum]|uniref:hypothetical protein n=1 Tax=Chryseobacterium proteolyticum TaxID=118127 RepID=UPI003983BF7A